MPDQKLTLTPPGPCFALWQNGTWASSGRRAISGLLAGNRPLPRYYAPPRGELLLAPKAAGKIIGCVGVRPFDEASCEVKRLYVDPAAGVSGAGHALASEMVLVARQLEYRRVVLDTASFMAAAARIYQSLGFRDITPYYDNPFSVATERYRIQYLN